MASVQQEPQKMGGGSARTSSCPDVIDCLCADTQSITTAMADSIVDAVPPHHNIIEHQESVDMVVFICRVLHRASPEKHQHVALYLQDVMQDICMSSGTGAPVQRTVKRICGAVLSAVHEEGLQAKRDMYSVMSTPLHTAMQRVRSFSHHLTSMPPSDVVVLKQDLDVIMGICDALADANQLKPELQAHFRELYLDSELVHQLPHVVRDLAAAESKVGRACAAQLYASILSALLSVFALVEAENAFVHTSNMEDDRCAHLFGLVSQWHEDLSRTLFEDQPADTASPHDPVWVIRQVSLLVQLLALCAQTDDDIIPHVRKWCVLLSEGDGIKHFLPLYQAYAKALTTAAIRFSSQHRPALDALKRCLTAPSPLLSFQAKMLKKTSDAIYAPHDASELKTTVLSSCVRVLKAMAADKPDALSAFVSSINLSVSHPSVHMRDAIVYNSVELLARIAEETAAGDPTTVSLIIAMLYQRLGFPASIVDVSIVERLGGLAVISTTNIFDSVMDMMFQLYLKVAAPKYDPDADSQEQAQFEFIGENVISTSMSAMAGHPDCLQASTTFLEKMLVLFNRLAISVIGRGLAVAWAAQDVFTPLLPTIAAFTKATLAPLTFQQRAAVISQHVVDSFRAFWFHVTMLRLFDLTGDENEGAKKALRDIALYSPVLVDERAKHYLKAQLMSSVEYIEDKVDAKELSSLQSRLHKSLSWHSLHTPDVHRLEFATTLYALAVFEVESRRLCRRGGNFFETFHYIEDKGQHHESRLPAMRILLDVLFQQHVEYLASQRSGREKLKILEDTAIFLIIKFNHRVKIVKQMADQFLSLLTERFPHLLWSMRVIVEMLNFLQAIHETSMRPDAPIGQQVTVTISCPPYTHVMPSTQETRTEIVKDFVSHCSAILQQALSHSAVDALATIQQYISQLQRTATKKDHAGLQMALQAIAAYPSDMPSSFLSTFGPSLALQNHYSGQLQGVLLAASVTVHGSKGTARDIARADTTPMVDPVKSDEDSYARSTRLETPSVVVGLSSWAERVLGRLKYISARLFADKDDASQEQQDAWMEQLQEAMYQATAILVFRPPGWDPLSHRTSTLSATMIDVLVWAPVKLNSVPAMTTAVACWSWLVSSRPEMETRILCAMEAAWSWTIENRVGLFSSDHGHSQGREEVFEADMRADPAHEQPVGLWLSFLIERFTVIAPRSLSQSQLITSMVVAALRAAPSVCRQASFWESRWKLYRLALTILHMRTQLNDNVQVVLRSQLYSSVLDYFSVPPRWTTTSLAIKAMEAMLACYSCMQADRVRCKAMDQVLAEHMPRRLRRAGHSSDPRFSRRCDLCLLLLRHEIERFLAWYHTGATQTTPITGEEEVKKYAKPSPSPSERTWKEYIGLAWQTNPAIVIQIAHRYFGVECVQKETARRVKANPAAVSHIPEAIHYLITKQNVADNCHELHHVLSWSTVSPITALRFLREYPGHVIISQYCLKALSHFRPDVILFYIPQLVQALRYDDRGYIQQYMLRAAADSQLLAHQMIWNMATNMYTDEDGEHRDEQLGDILELLMGGIKANLHDGALRFYEREFSFFEQITGISGRIRDKELGPERKAACLKELAKVKLQPGCYLPSSPFGMITAIDYSSGTPMQSAAKAPYLARFKVAQCTLEEIVEIGSSEEEVDLSERDSKWLACIFKVGDDVRQDMLALQIIQLMKNIFAEVGLDVALFPYRVVATGPGSGVIECVENATSRDQLGRQTNMSLYDYFLKVYGDEDTREFQAARLNFIKSMAAYSLVGFLLQIKDRHNGNIMVNKQGHIIHIDFGFMFESSPGGNIGFEPDMKLTKEMVLIMGGSQAAEPFRWFVDMCIRCYLAVRPYHDQIVGLVALMLDTGLPCFRTDRILESLRNRFQPNKTDAEAAAFMRHRINSCYLNTRTELYDKLQNVQNAIAH
ncbi:Pik4ca protein [Salpingoeca rosetta]|uniref:1-phosphatidylinositol 4-kinase n=1 Tax=Salpingoeca rosetta (strain ATCC 50818 / BSB-021) TaxID=946362 RepID=F2UAJ9_SALR5|nr:Pik4ca protein [Salpingoeca rosetta]EGD73415.1 Pik4ca protein [Salpingoeca rosetta]|eukprot:XP_004993697.1 Pik4ca protein [Salpingoeca rosetta]